MLHQLRKMSAGFGITQRYGTHLMISAALAFASVLPAIGLDTNSALVKQLPKTYKTVHFTLHSVGTSEAQWAASFLECLWLFVDRNFCPINKTYHRDVFLFPNKEDFIRHEQEVNLKTLSQFGYYDPKVKAFFSFPDSGYGTYGHEFIHSVVDECGLKLEPWAGEGVPAVFEKLFGYCDYVNPVFLVGYPNPWRVKALKRNLTTIDLRAVVLSRSWNEFSCEEQREVAVFLLKEGKLQRYLELARNGRNEGFSTMFEAAMGLPFAEIEPKWKNRMQDLQNKTEQIELIPGSAFFPTKQQFDEFLRTQGKILQQFR